MSVSLGSFSFDVSANIGPAQAALNRLAQQWAQVAQSQAVLTPQINQQQVQAGVQQVQQRVQQLTQQPAVLTIRSNLNEADRSLDQLLQHARAIGDARLALSVNVSDARTATEAMQ